MTIETFLVNNHDLTRLILEMLSYSDCFHLILINKQVYETLTNKEIFPDLWRILLGHLIGVSLRPCDYIEFEFDYGWKRAVINVKLRLEALSRMNSPGCQYQKYLRSYEGMRPDSLLVRDIMIGVSLLPPTIEACFQSSISTFIFTEELRRAWIAMNYSSWCCHDKGYLVIDDLNFLRRYLLLLSWVISSQSHLRVLVAEYEQLNIRCFQSKDYHSRCLGSLQHLIYIGNADYKSVQLWA